MSLDHPHPDDDRALLAKAREKLRESPRPDQHLAALAAAAFLAVCAIAFAVAAVLAPPLSHAPAAKIGVK